MIDALAFSITVVAVLAAVAVSVQGARKSFRPTAFGPVLGVLQLGLVVQAVLDVVAQVRGHRPGEAATHDAYLVASLLVVPLVALPTRRDEGGWSAVLLAGGLVVLAVLVVRLTATGRG